MASVTERIKRLPPMDDGGYVPVRMFEKTMLQSEYELCPKENVPGTIVGLVVDYMVRAILAEKKYFQEKEKSSGDKINEGNSPETTEWKYDSPWDNRRVMIEGFRIPLLGAYRAERKFGLKGAEKRSVEIFMGIKDCGDQSLTIACKLVSYDVWWRNPYGAKKSYGPDSINPDADTLRNIRIMLNRILNFLDQYGPVVETGFDFKPNGYTKAVDCGDGDYLTADALWDMKVLRGNITSAHTLQVLMYWIMGQHSGRDIFKSVHRIGIYNPRRSIVYTLDIEKIPKPMMEFIESFVIGYK